MEDQPLSQSMFATREEYDEAVQKAVIVAKIRRRAEALLADARAAGVIVTVTQRSTPPPRMRGLESILEVRHDRITPIDKAIQPVSLDALIPVLMGFDSARPIGFMEIDSSFLPPGPNYVFGLGYETVGPVTVDDDGTLHSSGHRLRVVSVQTDLQYLMFLRSKGIIPHDTPIKLSGS